jgi:hypothetical protein
MTHCKLTAFALVLLSFFLGGAQIRAEQQRGPSTAEERARALQVAKSLRTAPLADSTTKGREWLTLWLIEIPDITVPLCPGLLGDLGDSKTSSYPGALVGTMLASEAAYVIENPSQTKDKTVIYFAGIEGSLDAYRVMQGKDPDFHVKQLDEFRQKRDEGKLAEAVKSAAKKCK